MNDKAILKTITERQRLYDRLYDIGNFLLKKYNQCLIKNGKCNGPFRTEFCCYDCKYLTKKGCSIKCLWCKLWLCGTGSDHLLEQFKILNHLSKLNNLESPRRSKQYTMQRVRRILRHKLH